MKTFGHWLSCAALVLVHFSVPARTNHPTATVYNGTGINPVTFHHRSGLGLGQVWVSTVGNAHVGQSTEPSAAPSFLFVGLGGAVEPGRLHGGLYQGELLCRPPFVQLSRSTTGLHQVAIPDNASLIGPLFCVQAAVLRGAPLGGLRLELQNALLLQFGYDHCTGEFNCGG